MATASWEEASKCPRCSLPGEQVSRHPWMSGRRRGMIHILACRNERCRWFNTNWTVQVDEKGEIPIRNAGPKEYEAFSPFAESLARRTLEQTALEDWQQTGKKTVFDALKRGEHIDPDAEMS